MGPRRLTGPRHRRWSLPSAPTSAWPASRRPWPGRRITGAAVAFAALAVLAARTGGDGCLARADRAAFQRVRASRTQAGIVIAQAVSALAEPEVIRRRRSRSALADGHGRPRPSVAPRSASATRCRNPAPGTTPRPARNRSQSARAAPAAAAAAPVLPPAPHPRARTALAASAHQMASGEHPRSHRDRPGNRHDGRIDGRLNAQRRSSATGGLGRFPVLPDFRCHVA